jgi:hypothetical protein
MEKMIIHAYLTDGYYDWAVLFLKSLKYHHGEKFLAVLSSRELPEHQIEKLHSIYGNLEVNNKGFNINEMAKKANVNKETLLRYKRRIETSHVTQKSNVWKTMIADDDRIKDILQTMKRYRHQNYMIHFDVDMYFKKPINELIGIVRSNDISMRLRLNSKLNRKTMIGVQGYKLSDLTLEFVQDWINNIEKVPVFKRQLGHGQGACYHSYMKFKDRLSWGIVFPRFISPRMLETDVVWSANTKMGKEKTIALFNKDFENMKMGDR